MGVESNQTAFKQSYNDIKVSLILLKDNWRAYGKTELLSLAILVALLILPVILFLTNGPLIVRAKFLPAHHEVELRMPLNVVPTPNVPFYVSVIPTLVFFAVIGIFLFFYSYLSSSAGLSTDIILSGDQFTEFKNSFSYFKKNAFNYLLLSFVILWIPIVIVSKYFFSPFIQPFGEFSTFALDIFMSTFPTYLLQYALFVLLSIVFVGVTLHGSLEQSFRDNFWIIQHHPKRMFFTWLSFLLFFSLPLYVISFSGIFLLSMFFFPFLMLNNLLFVIIDFSSLLLAYPIMFLIATRIYATCFGTKANYS